MNCAQAQKATILSLLTTWWSTIKQKESKNYKISVYIEENELFKFKMEEIQALVL
jgi:hypothetical protein